MHNMPFLSAEFSRDELSDLVYALLRIGRLSEEAVTRRIEEVGEVTAEEW